MSYITISTWKLGVLVVTVAITAAISGMVGGLFSAANNVTADHFSLSNIVERVSAIESIGLPSKVDAQVYSADIKPMKDDIASIKVDVKSLLARQTVYSK